PDELLDWAIPEQIAMLNAQVRMLWHPEAAWGLGSMFVYEQLIPGELGLVSEGLARLGLDPITVGWFTEHSTVDLVHAADWLEVVASSATTQRDREIVYRAAIERGRAARTACDAMDVSWSDWKRTGVPPHLPARELRTAAGV